MSANRELLESVKPRSIFSSIPWWVLIILAFVINYLPIGAR